MNDQIKVELQKGLKSRPVYIPAWYRYDEEGSHLNDVCIDQCKWYYFHRFEVKLLTDVLDEIIDCVKESSMLVDLGSGNPYKTRLLIDQLLSTHERVAYVPVDISQGYNEQFHLNSIHRLNREMGDNIDISNFEIKNELVVKSSDSQCSYINVWMEARHNCVFDISKLDLTVRFEKGDKLYLHEEGGISCKYTIEQIRHLLNRASLGIVDSWVNEHVAAVVVSRK
ncbi:uncharacterized protein LOC127706613 [Mytilus californianus]|uniref:uncharacterized protein LOC127706613 n=1 Tax=Mytilus californianus TaxID=6549 RepID=UPI0022467506|nr:uncharacterized protein LOC127706613 [Mytilus californianus]